VAFPFALPPGAPLSLPPPSPGQVQGQVFLLEKIIQGCEFPAGIGTFDVLLGMDVLGSGSLVVQGNQTFSFSF
jgi:hypothetical protein